MDKIKRDISMEPKMPQGYHIEFVTIRHAVPMHWHNALEILFILNGRAKVVIEQNSYLLDPLDFIVIDSSKTHEIFYGRGNTMGVNLHISMQFIRTFLWNAELISFFGYSGKLEKGQIKPAMDICEKLKDMTCIFVRPSDSARLRTQALVMEILADLIDYFSIPVPYSAMLKKSSSMEKMKQICNYIEEHYRERILLSSAAQLLGFNKDYFCRLFKKSMGVSFVNYVNHVRMDRIYHDLMESDEDILRIIEKHGFENQKLFDKMFREAYGCSPREFRAEVRSDRL